VKEILPGVWHWTTPHPNLGGKRVSSYWLDRPGVAIDPLLPEDGGLEWFAQRPTPPTAVVLTNRHHYRDSGALRQRFGIDVHIPMTGLHEFGDDRPVIGYDYGEELAGGLVTVAVGGLSADDSGLHLPSLGALWLADTVVRSETEPTPIGWVMDSLMDDPPQTKQKLLETFRRLLDELEFEHLLLAHGLPLVGDGRTQLQRLVDSGGRTAVEAFAD
jgi:glyoxylase-like metal-dependent hydrolase (beta-lactamase superfamily II)